MKATLIFFSFFFATAFSVMENDHQPVDVSSLLKRPRLERRVPESFDLSWAAHDPVYHRCVANKCCNDEKCCPGGSVSPETCSQCRTKCEQSNSCTLGDRLVFLFFVHMFNHLKICCLKKTFVGQ